MGARLERAAACARGGQQMNDSDSTDIAVSQPTLSPDEVVRVVQLLHAVDAVPPDLERVLADVDGDRVVDEILSDEVHALRA